MPGFIDTCPNAIPAHSNIEPTTTPRTPRIPKIEFTIVPFLSKTERNGIPARRDRPDTKDADAPDKGRTDYQIFSSPASGEHRKCKNQFLGHQQSTQQASANALIHDHSRSLCGCRCALNNQPLRWCTRFQLQSVKFHTRAHHASVQNRIQRFRQPRHDDDVALLQTAAQPTRPGNHRSRASRGTLLISLHPRFADAILAGSKQVELRKVRPRLRTGDQLLLYSTKHAAAIVGCATVCNVIESDPESLWRAIGRVSALTAAEFFEYFASRSVAYAIAIAHPAPFANPITLRELRSLHSSFTLPQSYWYLQQRRELDRKILALCNRRALPARRNRNAA